MSVGNLFLQEPKLVRSGVNTGLIPRMQFFLNEIEIPRDKLKVIVQKNPKVLLYSLEKNLIPKLVFCLLMKLRMDTKQVQQLLLAYPQILNYNFDRTIIPMALYFVKELEFSFSEFRNILLRFPRIVTYSLPKTKHAVGYFRFELGMSASQVKRVLYGAPSLVGLNTDVNVKRKVEFLQTSLGLSDDQLRTLVATMPSLLVLNSDINLQPKLDYLRDTLQSDSVLRDTVLRLPTLLGYSLEKRIRPRMKAILKADLDPSCITIGIPMKQEVFESWLQRRIAKLRDQPGPLAVAPVTETNEAESSGRIVHWTRERRPPQDSR